ncbi:hypothetical protein [Gordonia sp. NPDC058843]|uniref:hypothetical protein n=1 Tax=Gordonia sp. NPDC058843 TaxID=3346648 RepID=UPI0036BD70BA
MSDSRWDLVVDTSSTPLVSVALPSYDQPRRLALVLEALTAQAYPVHGHLGWTSPW